ncbi:MAG: type II toxin-antitoxin system PemK/MazF family toxin [Candidatus Magasanikbacteria bacterium]|nr:type II toxin-antitoxin system PemK/MazF family toxin [Candidatus Magasanikbacteria bacterium]
MDVQKIAEQFFVWTKKKIRHHVESSEKEKYFREKEIWWAALGKNVGYEIDGKHKLFERPVLILKKYSKDMCFVVPLSSQIKDPVPWFQHVIETGEGMSAVNLTQGRSISKKRLLRKMMILNSGAYDAIINKFVTQFTKK